MRISILLGSLLVVTAIAFIACAPAPAAPLKETVIVAQTVVVPQTVIVSATAAPPSTKTPAATAVPLDMAAIQTAWKTSAHSKTYDLGKGPNTYCSRCHSPRNWDPASKVDAPPNCVSCKFPFDKEVRKAKSNILVAETDWKNIGCDICHKVEKNIVDPKPVAWNQATGKYDTIISTSELCEKCHTDSIAGTRHKIAVGGGAHTNEIGLTTRRPQECTDCHDPHTTQASCESCHKDARNPAKPINGHDAAHAKVACDACHDASGLKLGPTADNSQWVAFVVSTSPAGGPPTLKQVTSHVLQKSVDCTRCHYDNNPQKLRSMVTPTATRAPATPTVAK